MIWWGSKVGRMQHVSILFQTHSYHADMQDQLSVFQDHSKPRLSYVMEMAFFGTIQKAVLSANNSCQNLDIS